MYRLSEVRHDHCPGGCYVFVEEFGGDDPGFHKFHVPKQMFHGGMPWFWATTSSAECDVLP